MSTPTLRTSALILLAATLLIWSAARSWALGVYLSESKEQLKLKYDVTIHDHGDGRVTIELTLADEGRLKPLDEVQFYIQAQQKSKDGGYAADLLVTLNLFKAQNGTRTARVEILKDLAQRAELVLNTHTLDGKTDWSTRLHHAIPIAKYLNNPPAAERK